MAKKPAARKADVRTVSTEEELKAVCLELPVDVHRELRIEVAKRIPAVGPCQDRRRGVLVPKEARPK